MKQDKFFLKIDESWEDIVAMDKPSFRSMILDLIEKCCDLSSFNIIVDGKEIGPISFVEEFEAPSHTFENHSLREHSIRVLDRCYDQCRFYDFSGVIAFEVFAILLVLHDIGKNVSFVDKGSKIYQHRYTIQMLKHFMEIYGKQEHILLLSTLIDMDPLGQFLKGQRSFDETKNLIKKAAKKAKFCEVSFFYILKFYYFCDASSYDNLKKRIFYDYSDGRMALHPEHSRKNDFEELTTFFAKAS
ncbi:hypothetical protein AB834_05095 [PVC group bacterium (ex Bugula neritina AB1)]|nr:hypothetical protein AB834_05095 [PVC group bacterium (ex Bugula neritina AB1)]